MKIILNPNDKSKICESVLRDLPSWFGNENAVIQYINEVRELTFFASESGFAALKTHNAYTAEIYVMGVYLTEHGKGYGRALIERCETYCREQKIEYLTVKTLAESRECEDYKRTRLFYHAMGFKPLEVFKTYWDEDNPCLFMVKKI